MPPSPRPAVPDRVDTQRHIANVTEALLKEIPLEELSVKQIIEAAQVSRATFYHYFKDKHDVVTWIYISEVDRLVEKHKSTNDLSLEIFRFMYSHRDFFIRAFSYAEQNSLVDYMVERSLEDCIKILRNALKTEVLPRDMQAATDFFVGGCLRTWHGWIARGMQDQPEFILSVIMNNMPDCLRPYIK